MHFSAGSKLRLPEKEGKVKFFLWFLSFRGGETAADSGFSGFFGRKRRMCPVLSQPPVHPLKIRRGFV